MAKVAIGLGSNLGNRLENLQTACRELSAQLHLTAASPVYETAPMYVESQPPFYNAAVLAHTEMGPLALLRTLKGIERHVGRTEAPRYGPREIDLDLLSYGTAKYSFRQNGEIILTIPHPMTPERRFVLQPLYDLDAKMTLPGLGSVDCLLASTLSQASNVRKVSNAVLHVLRS